MEHREILTRSKSKELKNKVMKAKENPDNQENEEITNEEIVHESTSSSPSQNGNTGNQQNPIMITGETDDFEINKTRIEDKRDKERNSDDSIPEQTEFTEDEIKKWKQY